MRSDRFKESSRIITIHSTSRFWLRHWYQKIKPIFMSLWQGTKLYCRPVGFPFLFPFLTCQLFYNLSFKLCCSWIEIGIAFSIHKRTAHTFLNYWASLSCDRAGSCVFEKEIPESKILAPLARPLSRQNLTVSINSYKPQQTPNPPLSVQIYDYYWSSEWTTLCCKHDILNQITHE